jgi:hypothetical protein
MRLEFGSLYINSLSCLSEVIMYRINEWELFIKKNHPFFYILFFFFFFLETFSLSKDKKKFLFDFV